VAFGAFDCVGQHRVLFVAGGRNYPALGTRIALLTRTELCCMHTSGACKRYLLSICMKLRCVSGACKQSDLVMTVHV
jgi:hypothetical protein